MEQCPIEGKLLSLVERTHEDVRDIKHALISQRTEIDAVKIEQASQRLWLRLLAGAIGLGVVGGGGAAGLLQMLQSGGQ